MSEGRAVIRVVDFESTGLEPPAEVVEVGICDLVLVGDEWTVEPPRSWLCGVAGIPPEVRAVHHIQPAEVEGLPPFDPAAILAEGVTVYAAHKIDFESLWLPAEAAPRLCTFKAALRVWPNAPGHSNGTLRYWLEDEGRVRLDPALAMPPHRAGPDAYVTAHVLKALLATGTTGKDMVAWTRQPALLPRCPIGQHRGKQWADVDFGFLQWMTRQADMDADLVWNAWQEIDRRQATPLAPSTEGTP